ncbi:MAG: GNAT family N-acetyltransferase [Chloroflexota bacterium]
MSVQINRANIDQAPIIAEVLHQAFLEYEHLYTPQGFAATTPTAEQIQNRWSEGPVWVAVQNELIIGTVAAMPKGESLYVRSMAILPTGRGQGIGKLLLEEAERFARENGFKRIFLSTTPFLDRAIRLYEQFGFKRTEDGPHELYGTPLFTMEKAL